MSIEISEAIEIPSPATLPDISKLTTNAIDGTGVFDTLMRVVKLHLTEEFTKQRITGKEYASVYLGSMQAVLQQSIAFILNDQQVSKINADIALVRQQIVTELANTDDTIPLGLGFNGTTDIEGLVASKKSIETKQLELVDAQVSKTEQDIIHVKQQIITELAQTSDYIPENLGLNSVTDVQGIIKATIDKTTKENDLVEQKIVTEIAQIDDVIPNNIGLQNAIGGSSILGLVKSQKDKTDKETILLAQKTNTELSQTSDSVSTTNGALNTSSTLAGIISTQKGLYSAQTTGFSRDAEQKAVKMILDTWNVRATTDPTGINVSDAGLSDAVISACVTKLKQGIGI